MLHLGATRDALSGARMPRHQLPLVFGDQGHQCGARCQVCVECVLLLTINVFSCSATQGINVVRVVRYA